MLLKFSNWLAFEIFKLAEGSRIGEALSFFIYDTIKILLLLFVMIFIIGVLRSYLPQNKLKIWLNKKGIKANFFAALFGAVTPFCSCSSIPIFIGMVGAGIPLGIVFTFLIVSPLINEYLVVLMVGSFGWKISILYVISGMLIGIVSGVIMGKLKLEKYLNNDLFSDQNNAENNVISYPNFNSRLKYGYIEAISITKKIWYWVLIGVGIGAFIHNYVPQEAIQSIIGKAGIFGVPLAVILGVPMYGSCAAIVPIAIVLFQKGVPLGTALSFMMAITALSLPEAVMLRRAIKLQLIIIFFAITTVAIIITGYLFNILQKFII